MAAYLTSRDGQTVVVVDDQFPPRIPARNSEDVTSRELGPTIRCMARRHPHAFLASAPPPASVENLILCDGQEIAVISTDDAGNINRRWTPDAF